MRQSNFRRWCAAAALPLVMMFVLSLPAGAQERSLPAKWDQRYIAILGAWNIDRRCRILATADRRELEWLSAQLSLAYAKRFGPAVLARLQEGSHRLIGEKRFAGCGANNQRIVREALPWARADVKAVAGEVYDPKTSYRDYALERFTQSVARVRLDVRCNHVPAHEKGQLTSLERAVAAGLTDAYGADFVNKALDRAKTVSARNRLPCGSGTMRAVEIAIQDLRALRREFTP